MGLSETIIAASIGAIATVSAAMFQLFSALRTNKSRIDMRPKRGSTVRSFIAVGALMVVSAVGGYLFSEFRTERTAEDMHNMRDELNAKLQVLATTTERLAAHESAMSQPIAAMRAAEGGNNVESVIYAPACQSGTGCSADNPQRLTLCGAIPTAMQVRKVELFARAAGAQTVWEQAATNFEQDIGGGKFIGVPIEHAEDDAHKAVCVDFVHWSSEPHLARLVLQYGASTVVEPGASQQSPPSVATTQSSMTSAHTVSMASPTATQ